MIITIIGYRKENYHADEDSFIELRQCDSIDFAAEELNYIRKKDCDEVYILIDGIDVNEHYWPDEYYDDGRAEAETAKIKSIYDEINTQANEIKKKYEKEEKVRLKAKRDRKAKLAKIQKAKREKLKVERELKKLAELKEKYENNI